MDSLSTKGIMAAPKAAQRSLERKKKNKIKVKVDYKESSVTTTGKTYLS